MKSEDSVSTNTRRSYMERLKKQQYEWCGSQTTPSRKWRGIWGLSTTCVIGGGRKNSR